MSLSGGIKFAAVVRDRFQMRIADGRRSHDWEANGEYAASSATASVWYGSRQLLC